MTPEKRAFLRKQFGVTDAEIDEQFVAGQDRHRNGWKQLSRKYRFVVRLPPGLSGSEALRKYAPQKLERMQAELAERFERECAEHFLTYVADKIEGCHATLTPAEFAGFKAAEE